ncbi:MAG: hypothetical protein RBS99_17055 [Rhodospirillales bacterium]|jgi:hypothetical protein|nr:hypothetical protein [Rhodospirillales bacterium]
MKHLKEAIMLLTANDEPLGPEWLDLDPERLPLIEPEARRALADAFGNGRSLLAIKAAFVRALAAGARQKGLPM